jgi:hypothetical protein
MTTLTMRVVRGDFIVTGPDIAPMKFKSRREAIAGATGQVDTFKMMTTGQLPSEYFADYSFVFNWEL